MALSESPLWVLIYALFVLVSVGALVALLAWQVVRPRSRKRVRIGETTVELWVRQRRFPVGTGAAIVPVAPDLKMAFGVAKWLRDATAGRAQMAADKAAPLEPGQTFVAPGGKYRFRACILAVVMDQYKRTTPEMVAAGVGAAIRAAHGEGIESCIVPDFTNDLLRHPQWITEEQRRDTCRPVAKAMLDGVRSAAGAVATVRIWVWDKSNLAVWEEAFDRFCQEVDQTSHEPAPSAA